MKKKRKHVSVRGEVYNQFRAATWSEGKTMASVLDDLINQELDIVERIEKRHPLLLKKLLATRRASR